MINRCIAMHEGLDYTFWFVLLAHTIKYIYIMIIRVIPYLSAVIASVWGGLCRCILVDITEVGATHW